MNGPSHSSVPGGDPARAHPMSTSSRGVGAPGGGPALLGRAVTPATLADLWSDLTWPKLLQAPRLALRPSRIGIAFIYLLGVALLVIIADKIDGDQRSNLLGAFLGKEWVDLTEDLQKSVWTRNPVGAASALYMMFVRRPAALTQAAPWMVIIITPLLTLWTAIFGGAISRMAACDHAHGLRITWPEGLGFALGRWHSLWAAQFAPLLIIWVICLALAAAGWALFSVPVLNVLAGLGWVLVLIAALVASVMSIVYAVGQPMLVPAVAVESADAIDAIQHAHAFTFAKPARLVIYSLILLVQLAISIFVIEAVLQLTTSISQRTTTNWLEYDTGQHVIKNLSVRPPENFSSTDRAARWLVRFWSAAPALLASSFAVSLYWCASTMLYLAMRRVCDGQDTAEIWMPGIVNGTMAAQDDPPRTGSGPPVGPATSGTPQGVSDTGPADES